MTAGEFTTSARSRLADRSWQLTGAAGAIQLGALAVALAGGSLALLAKLVAAAGVLLGLYVLAPRAAAAARRYRGLIVFAALLVGASVYVAANLSRVNVQPPTPGH
jgi:hypothetical protein